MFLHLSVSQSVYRGVSASVHAGIHPLPLGRHPPLADTSHGQTVILRQQTPPCRRLLQRTLRILLECILV